MPSLINNARELVDPVIASYGAKKVGDLMFAENGLFAYQSDMGSPIGYGQSYFDNYVSYSGSEIAIKLNEARERITSRYCKVILDIGIGSGEFILYSSLDAFGFDINPCGVEWLMDRGKYIDPYLSIPEEIDGLCFWDSLEHMSKPSSLLNRCRANAYIFISMPIYPSLNEIVVSKHFKLNEHFYYFTRAGLIEYMGILGYVCIEVNNDETIAGREGIESFAFRREKMSNDQ